MPRYSAFLTFSCYNLSVIYMNFYENLNKMIDYIEDNLSLTIDIKRLALMVGLNEYTLQRLFSIICNISINEYIRKRRLTLAGRDLVQNDYKIIDVAVKYGYDSPTAFSRAFTKFHGIKPSLVKLNESKLKYYPKLQFDIPKYSSELEYEIIELDKLVLYGIGVKTDSVHIKKDAPNLFINVEKNYSGLPHPDYGMVSYKNRFNSDTYEYWVLWKNKYYDFDEKIIPKSKWLKFKINSYNSDDIQAMIKMFYCNFLNTCKYKIREIPELEYYQDGVTHFLVPID